MIAGQSPNINNNQCKEPQPKQTIQSDLNSDNQSEKTQQLQLNKQDDINSDIPKPNNNGQKQQQIIRQNQTQSTTVLNQHSVDKQNPQQILLEKDQKVSKVQQKPSNEQNKNDPKSNQNHNHNNQDQKSLQSFQSKPRKLIKKSQYTQQQQPFCNNNLQTKQQLATTSLVKPIIRKPLEIVIVSDNHGDYKMMNQILQLKGDIFIHGGDFTYNGKDQHFQKFFEFLDKIKFKHKIVISGNHQNILAPYKLKTITTMSRQKILAQLKKRCTYLQHQSIQIQGLKIFASPHTPQYCQKPTTRAFQYKPSADKVIWDPNHIPNDTQLLITHGPPYGILDQGKGGKRAGSVALKQLVQKIKPKYHIFGHIHESKGMNKIGDTIYMNVTNTPTRIVI